jgi:protein phosphatase
MPMTHGVVDAVCRFDRMRSAFVDVQQSLEANHKAVHLRVDIGARSDVGRVHTRNQDCYCVLREPGLFVVSDGVGGHAHGEMASAIAVEAVTTHCLQAVPGSGTPPSRESRAGLSDQTGHLANAVLWANRKIRSAAAKEPTSRGMSATLVAAWLEGERLSLAHIGDSRAYLLRNGALKQLTNDHSLAAERVRRGMVSEREAQNSLSQSVLLRALGTEDRVEVDTHEIILADGDFVLLCTDGLTHMVSDAEIAGALAASESAQIAADQLVAMANHHGGKDNVTAVAIRVCGGEVGLAQRLRRLAGFGSSNAQSL